MGVIVRVRVSVRTYEGMSCDLNNRQTGLQHNPPSPTIKRAKQEEIRKNKKEEERKKIRNDEKKE